MIKDLSTKNVLTTEFCFGSTLDTCASSLPQEKRNALGERLFKLSMFELFAWNFVQSDPNFSNFMYDSELDRIGLIDFGAARHYDEDFVQHYLNLVRAAATMDEELLVEAAIELGFLTGEEPAEAVEAFRRAAYVIGEPFAAKGAYDFSRTTITKRVINFSSSVRRGAPTSSLLNRTAFTGVLLAHS